VYPEKRQLKTGRLALQAEEQKRMAHLLGQLTVTSQCHAQVAGHEKTAKKAQYECVTI
jgi:hypothetical protein